MRTLLLMTLVTLPQFSVGLWHPASKAHAPPGGQHGSVPTSSRIVFTVMAPKDGMYLCDLKADDNAQLQADLALPRVAHLKVNGRKEASNGDLRIAANESVLSRSVALRHGLNTLAFEFNTAVSVRGLEVTGAVGSSTGSPESITSFEAENAQCSGHIIGPSYQSYSSVPHLSSEASGRRACQLTAAGEFVEFTVQETFNAISLRYSIPDSPSGTGYKVPLELSVNGVAKPDLTLTSSFSWYYGNYPYTNYPGDGSAHHFFAEVRALLNAEYPAGAKVRVTFKNTSPTEVAYNGNSGNGWVNCEPGTIGCSRKWPLVASKQNFSASLLPDVSKIGVWPDYHLGLWPPCSPTSAQCCNPTQGQYCSAGVPCQDCGGGNACECPSGPSPAPAPTPTPAPAPTLAPSLQCDMHESARKDCGWNGVTEATCVSKGCCWKATADPTNPQHYPWCFYSGSPAPAPSAFAVTVDLLDVYNVPQPYAAPTETHKSVADFGADPTGQADSATALKNAITAAQSQGGVVWIPEGSYKVGDIINVPDGISIFGAGPWHTVLSGTGQRRGRGAIGFYAKYGGDGGSRKIELHDFAIIGDVRERCDGCQVNGIGGAPTAGSVVKNLWIQHTKCGLWLDGPGSDLQVIGNTIRDTTADGINLHTGWSNVHVAHNSFRNTGDDGIALWSGGQPDYNNQIENNKMQIPVLANNIAIYGGHDNFFTANVLMDTVQGGGIHVGNRFNSVALSGTTYFTQTTLVRCGCLDGNWKFGIGAIWFYALDSPMTGTVVVQDSTVNDSPYNAIGAVSNGKAVSNLVFKRIDITNVGTFVMQPNTLGDATFSDVTAKGIGYHDIYSCYAFKMIDQGGNSDWYHPCGSSCPAEEACNSNGYCGHCGWPSQTESYMSFSNTSKSARMSRIMI